MPFAPPSPPVIQVNHLPSASSFYATLTQPLSIRYLSATQSFPYTLHFGRPGPSGPEILFSLTQALTPHPPLNTIALSASNTKQIKEFYSKSRILSPQCLETGIIDLDGGEGQKAITTDADGNIIEAIYAPYGVSSEKEARRVLDWQKSVAASVADDTQSGSRRELGSGRRTESAPMRLVKRETVTETWAPLITAAEQVSNGMGNTGITGQTIVGTLLGAAAGAAITYAVTRMNEPTTTADFVEVIPASSRASAKQQDGIVDGARYSRYMIAPAPSPPTPLMRAGTWTAGERRQQLQIDSKSHVSTRSSTSRRTTGSKTRSRSEHPSTAETRFERPLALMPAPGRDGDIYTHVSRKSHKSRSQSHVSGSRSHASRRDDVIEVFEDLHLHSGDECKSTHSRRSKHSSHSKNSKQHSCHVDDVSASEGGSYASARSHASSSTIKASRQRRHSHADGAVITIVGKEGTTRSFDTRDLRERSPDRPRHSSRSRVSARDVPLPRSVVSARDVPLPRSMVSQAVPRSSASSRLRQGRGREREYRVDGEGGWLEGDKVEDDSVSVAPSDSVSCVGYKRERERLRGRMGSAW